LRRGPHLPLEQVLLTCDQRTAAFEPGRGVVGQGGQKVAGSTARPDPAANVALAGGAAVVLGGWFTASAVIAGHGWYHARLGHQVPWMPVAMAGFLGLLLALRRSPVVARALTAPGMVSRLKLPHSFRVARVAFLLALGHLPALFALPAISSRERTVPALHWCGCPALASERHSHPGRM
jgi:hypothetical protein